MYPGSIYGINNAASLSSCEKIDGSLKGHFFKTVVEKRSLFSEP
jgi:hypothetical protein